MEELAPESSFNAMLVELFLEVWSSTRIGLLKLSRPPMFLLTSLFPLRNGEGKKQQHTFQKAEAISKG